MYEKAKLLIKLNNIIIYAWDTAAIVFELLKLSNVDAGTCFCSFLRVA